MLTYSQTSELTRLLASKDTKEIFLRAENERDSMLVTVYLPNRSSMDIRVRKNASVESVIRKTLDDHKEKRILPALNYRHLEEYELRMHEGDGEPDLDFRLDRRKPFRDYGSVDELCLVETERSDDDSNSGDKTDDTPSIGTSSVLIQY